MKITLENINNLKPYEFNNRTHPQEQIDELKHSIQTVGFTVPIVVDEDNILLAGHGRLMAAFQLGLKQVPTHKITGLSDEVKRTYRIYDNEGTRKGKRDYNNLELEIGSLIDSEFNLEPWGLLDLELNIDEPEVEDDNFEGDTSDDRPVIIKQGDLIELGRHRVLCGDSYSKDLLYFKKRFDLLHTDPPYGIGKSGQKKAVCKNPKHNRKYHEDLGWDESPPPATFFEAVREISENQIIWGGNYFPENLIASMGWLVWDKGQDLKQSDCELAYTSLNKALKRFICNRAEIARDGSVHPTQKPIKVLAFAFKYAGEFETVLDPFLGSGSTLIAAEQLNRTCYGIELEPKYCQVVVDRYLNQVPDSDILINGEKLTSKEWKEATSG